LPDASRISNDAYRLLLGSSVLISTAVPYMKVGPNRSDYSDPHSCAKRDLIQKMIMYMVFLARDGE
jgi:hypothetical protein